MLTLFLICKISVKYFEHRLDHFNPMNNQNFTQKYYENDNYVNLNNFSNIILYIGSLKSFSNSDFDEETVRMLAYDNNALIVYLEHRFLSGSSPMNTSIELMYETLNIQNSIEDILDFQIHLNNKYKNPKYILYGKGYGGTLAAWHRTQFANMTLGAVVENAPLSVNKTVHTDKEFHIALSSQCQDTLISIFNEINTNLFSSKENQEKIKEKFGFSTDQNSAMVGYAIFDVFSEYGIDICTTLTNNFDINKFASWFTSTLIDNEETQLTIDLFNNKVKAYMMCYQIGGFKESSGYIQSYTSNQSLFQKVCQQFKVDNFDLNQINTLYGGTKSAANKVAYYITKKIIDPRTYLLHSNFKSQLLIIRDISQLFDTVGRWLSRDCEKMCLYGRCRYEQCICDDGWEGVHCTEQTHSSKWFNTLTVACVLLPAILLIAISGVVWIHASRTIEHNR